MSTQSKNSLYLIRHGATEWSVSGQHTGTTDLPLLPEGEQTAREVATLLKDTQFTAVFSSPLSRAQRTAALAGLSDVQIDEDLREWDYGAYEGKTTPQICEERGEPDWEIFKDGVVAGDTPGETVEDVAARVSHVLARAIPLLEQGNVALVAHGHSLRILASVFLRAEPRFGSQLMLSAGAVSMLGFYHDNPCIKVWNHQTGL